ncbi:MAG: TRZ/ATZ family hydrolase [Pseudomonadales bacterium]|nr:TRZ/ATZ family hydrolase [Pseudomonadales bacterium]
MTDIRLSSAPPSGALEADTVIHARWIIPMTRQGIILSHHSLIIKNRKIAAIVPTSEAKSRYQARYEYQLDSHALIPGLINAHGHAPMTLFRGYADDMPLHPWLQQRIWPAESKWVSEDFVSDGGRLAIAEMLLGGTTCFSDMYFFPDQVARVALEARIRVQLASPVLDFATVWAQNADEYIHKVTLLNDTYRDNEFINVAFGPHATYTVSDAPLKKISMLADELDLPVHMHVHENAQEITDALRGGGARPLQRLEQLGLLSQRLQCVHMTQLDDADIELLLKNAVNVVHCPASNLKLASGLCPVARLLEAGVNVSLGTDGSASNNDLDMFSEMRLAALLGKAIANDAAAISAWQALGMATINGARSLGLDEHIGSLAPDKYADVVAVDLDRINSHPVYDPVSTLVYSSAASQVTHVWVGGHLNVEQRKLTTLDESSLLRNARQWAKKIQQE